MKTGYKIATDLLNSSWYYLDTANIIHGPIIFSKLRELVINGVIEVTTKVSRDKVVWQCAGSIEAIGFDCIVMSTEESFQLFGPFATDFVENNELAANLPSNASLFVRIGDVGEVASAGGVLASLEHDSTKSKELDVCKQQLDALEIEKATVDAELDSLKKQLVTQEQKVASTSDQLAKLSAEKTVLAEEKHALETELGAAKTIAEKQQSELSTKYAEIAASKATSEAELAVAKQQIASLEQKSADVSEQLAKLSAEKTALVEEKQALETELGATKIAAENQQSELSAKHAEIIASKVASEAELAVAKQQIASLEQKSADVREQLAKLSAEKTTLAAEKQVLETELDAAKTTAEKQQSELSEKYAELVASKATVDSELAVAKGQIISLEQQTADANKQLNDITVEQSALIKAKSNLEAEANAIKSDLEKYQQEWILQKSELDLQNATLKQELAEAKQFGDDVKQQLSKLSIEKTTLADLNSSLESKLQSAKSDAEKQKAEFATKNEELLSVNTSLEAKLASLKEQERASAAKIDNLSSEKSELIIQVERIKSELEHTKNELLTAVKQAQNDLIKEQLRADQAVAASKAFEAEAMRAATLERENNELISENKQLLQQKHELADSLSTTREHLAKEQMRSQHLADAANKIKRKLSRALNNVIDDPAEDVITLSANNTGEEYVVDVNSVTTSGQEMHSTNYSTSTKSSRDEAIIHVDENGEIPAEDKVKVKRALSLEAQLQKELMFLRAQRASKASQDSGKEETPPFDFEKNSKDNGFWKHFFKK